MTRFRRFLDIALLCTVLCPLFAFAEGDIPPSLSITPSSIPQQAQDGLIDAMLVRQIIDEITENVCEVTYSLSSEEDGETIYVFDTESECVITITTDTQTGDLLYIEIDDSSLFDLAHVLKDRESFLSGKGSAAMWDLYACLVQSKTLALEEDEQTELLDFDMTGIFLPPSLGIQYYGVNEIETDSLSITYERMVDVEGSGRLSSTVTLTFVLEDEEGPYLSPTAPTSAVSPLSPTSAISLPGSEPAEEKEFPYEAQTRIKKVLVRKLPDQWSRKVTRIEKAGTSVTVLGEEKDARGITWYQVKTKQGRTGYIRGDLIGTEEEIAAAANISYGPGSVTPTSSAPGSAPIAATSPSSPSSPTASYTSPSSGPGGMSFSSPFSFGLGSYDSLNVNDDASIEGALAFTRVSIARQQKLAVYSAPSTKSWRGADGKAYVSTNGAVYLAGFEGKWMLIMYSTTGGSARVGYVDSTKVRGTLPDKVELEFEGETKKLLKAATLTDDTEKKATAIVSLAKDTEVTYLAKYRDMAYIETSTGKKTARGFIPLDCIEEPVEEETEDTVAETNE